jgi:hypothetical protein
MINFIDFFPIYNHVGKHFLIIDKRNLRMKIKYLIPLLLVFFTIGFLHCQNKDITKKQIFDLIGRNHDYVCYEIQLSNSHKFTSTKNTNYEIFIRYPQPNDKTIERFLVRSTNNKCLIYKNSTNLYFKYDTLDYAYYTKLSEKNNASLHFNNLLIDHNFIFNPSAFFNFNSCRNFRSSNLSTNDSADLTESKL